MKITVAAVQPKSFRDKEEPKNLDLCLQYVDQAVDKGAKIICFPEFYPGPNFIKKKDFDPTETLCEKARDSGVYLIVGEMEGAPRGGLYSTLKLISPDGRIVRKYRRVQPPPKEVNVKLTGKDILKGPGPLEVYETEFGKLGLLCCSEVYWPELSRILAIRGAEIIFLPVGGLLYELFDTWKHLIWARAIENHVYTVTCQNIYGMEDGIATIAGPEKILAETKEEGVIVASLDLDRIKWLREHEQTIELPYPFKTIPGLIMGRRPEIYSDLVKKKKSIK